MIMKLRLLPILLLVLLLSSFAFADFTTDNQLWASLQDGNTSSFDIYGGVTGVEGVVGGAFDFGGVTNAYVNTEYDISGKNNIIINASIYLTTTTGENNIVSKYSTGTEQVILRVNNGDLQFYIYDTALRGGTTQTFTTTNEWVNISAVYDGSTLKTYVNGVESGTSYSATGNIKTVSQSLWVGMRETGQAFNGKIDEVNIEVDSAKVFYASFDSLYDQSNNSNSLSAYNGVTYDATTDSYDFDGTDDYVKSTGIKSYIPDDFSISLWFNADTIGANERIFELGEGNDDRALVSFDVTGTKLSGMVEMGGEGSATAGSTTINTGEDYHVVMVWNESATTFDVYLNGTIEIDGATGIGDVESLVDDYILFGTGDAQYFDGTISGIAIFNRSLSSTEVAQLYAEGRDYTPYPEVTETGIYVPKITEANQIGTVEVTSATYTPIFTGQVTVTDTANVTATLTGSVYGNGGGSIATCNIEINGSEEGYTTTSPPNNKYRSLFATTNIVELTTGTYNVTVNCKQTGSASYDATNLKLLMNQYVRNDGTPLKTNYYNFEADITTTDYAPIGLLYFNTSELTLDNGTTRYAVFEASLNEIFDSTGTICIRGGALGINTSDFCRYGGAGTTGSGSAFAMIRQLPANLTVPLIIYGKSTTGDGSINFSMNAFEMIAHTEEINLTEFSNNDITSSDWQQIANHTFSNNEHVSFTPVAKASFSVQSNSGASTMQFRFRLNSAVNETSDVIYRDVSLANQQGIVTLQETFQDLGVGDYVLYLEAKASNSDSTIVSGQMINYVANPEDFTANTFNITAINKWTNETIYNFSANLNGLITVSDDGTGLIQAPVIGNPIDITIIREGHPSKLYEDYNIIYPLEAELGDNYVAFYDGTDGSPLNGSNVTVSLSNGTDLELITNASGFIHFEYYDSPYLFTYAEATGYVTPITFNYTATSTPFNISYNITRINLTINIHDEVTGDLINGTNITIDIIDGTAFQYTTTTGTLNFDYFTPGVYEFRYYSTLVDDYKLRSDFINITATSDQDINLYLLNESDTGITTATITFNVFGSDLSAVEDAEVVVARYYSSSNSFVDVWSRKTNSQGAAVGQFETIDAFYQYRVIYNGQVGFISSNSGVQFNANDQIDIFIDTQTNLVSQFNTLDSIDYTDISFTQTSNTTGTFQFSFSGDTSSTVCLEVTSYNFADNGFNLTCVTSTGGTLFLPVEAGSYETTFVAKATIEVSSDLGPQVVDSDTQILNGLNEPTDSASWKENLAWIAVLVTITSALLFISFSPNAALLFQGIAFLAMTASPIQIVPIPISVGVVFICIVLLIINVSRGRG